MKIQFLYHEMIIKQKEYNDIKKINIMNDIIFAKSYNNLFLIIKYIVN